MPSDLLKHISAEVTGRRFMEDPPAPILTDITDITTSLEEAVAYPTLIEYRVEVRMGARVLARDADDIDHAKREMTELIAHEAYKEVRDSLRLLRRAYYDRNWDDVRAAINAIGDTIQP